MKVLSFNAPIFAKRVYDEPFYTPAAVIAEMPFERSGCSVDPDFDGGILASEIDIAPGLVCSYDALSRDHTLARKVR